MGAGCTAEPRKSFLQNEKAHTRNCCFWYELKRRRRSFIGMSATFEGRSSKFKVILIESSKVSMTIFIKSAHCFTTSTKFRLYSLDLHLFNTQMFIILYSFSSETTFSFFWLLKTTSTQWYLLWDLLV